ncbi:MAG: LysR family transcriptional regulator [Betaproteobacteria bacterium]|nr:MAG: LysR family transcriptional regulator [Betaproteobacteria bacterium]
MRKASIAEMNAFVAIAERASFARAAAQLGVSRSSLSESLRALEERSCARCSTISTPRWNRSTYSGIAPRAICGSPCRVRRREPSSSPSCRDSSAHILRSRSRS